MFAIFIPTEVFAEWAYSCEFSGMMQFFSATPALACVAIVCAVYGDDTIYPVVQTKNGPVRGVQLRVNVNNTATYLANLLLKGHCFPPSAQPQVDATSASAELDRRMGRHRARCGMFQSPPQRGCPLPR